MEDEITKKDYPATEPYYRDEVERLKNVLKSLASNPMLDPILTDYINEQLEK